MSVNMKATCHHTVYIYTFIAGWFVGQLQDMHTTYLPTKIDFWLAHLGYLCQFTNLWKNSPHPEFLMINNSIDVFFQTHVYFGIPNQQSTHIITWNEGQYLNWIINHQFGAFCASFFLKCKFLYLASHACCVLINNTVVQNIGWQFIESLLKPCLPFNVSAQHECLTWMPV